MFRARTVWKLLLGLLAVILVVVAGLAVHFHYWTYRSGFAFDVTVGRAREAIARHARQFQEDQAYAAGLPLFASRTGGLDAGPVIGPRIHWVRIEPGEVAYPSLSDLAIDLGRYEQLGEDWPNAPPELWRDLDFRWMAQLAQLDFWDLEQNSIPNGADVPGPTPHLTDLLAWAKLRLAKGHQENALSTAVAEVEDLARLCFTTETFSTEMDGIALLGVVREAQKRLGGSSPVTDVGRIHRAVIGAHAFARLETPPEHAARFDQLRVGRCAALHDGAWIALATRADLRESRAAEYRRLASLLERAPECRLRRIRERWGLPDDPAPSGGAWWERTLWRWSPAWRRMNGEILVAIGAQDWFKGYDRPRCAK